jgi:hypothetical protein
MKPIFLAAAFGLALGASVQSAVAYTCGCHEDWELDRLSNECPDGGCLLQDTADLNRGPQGTRVTVGNLTIWLEA